jgi:hypothetical protein
MPLSSQQSLPVKTIEIEGSQAYHLTGVAKRTVLLSATTQRELLETGLLPKHHDIAADNLMRTSFHSVAIASVSCRRTAWSRYISGGRSINSIRRN